MPGPPPELRRRKTLKERSAGRWGEDLALEYLRHRGYSLVERNYRTRYGELDLVVLQGNTLVFVEVKLRKSAGFGDPLEAVTPRKQAAIRSLAKHYLAVRRPRQTIFRFDVVGISFHRGEPQIAHVENAF